MEKTYRIRHIYLKPRRVLLQDWTARLPNQIHYATLLFFDLLHIEMVNNAPIIQFLVERDFGSSAPQPLSRRRVRDEPCLPMRLPSTGLLSTTPSATYPMFLKVSYSVKLTKPLPRRSCDSSDVVRHRP